MKSSKLSFANSTSPRITSCTTVTPSSGVRKRSAVWGPRVRWRSRQKPS
jgi:hypothetical protein